MANYNVIVETTGKPIAGLADQVLDQLADYGAAVARSPRGRAEVILTVPATSLRQAVQTGLALVEDAIAGYGRIQAVEAMTTVEFDERTERAEPPAVPELVSVSEAADALHVSRQAVLQRIETGSLPAIKVGTAWVLPKASIAAAMQALDAGKAKVLEELGPDATARDVLDRAKRLDRARNSIT